MTKKSKRRSSSVEHRSTKRRKSNSDNQPIYSTRDITWEDQQSLPPRFREEPYVWPALKILEERGSGKKKEYLVEWETHPTTGEVFAPTWEPAGNIGQELRQEWKTVKAAEGQLTSPQESSSVTFARSITQPNIPHVLTTSRRLNNRRIIPDSSAELEEVFIPNSSPSQTPTLTESPGSVRSGSSSVEISETQQAQLPTSIHVNVPPAPVDKSDWESLRGSQFSKYETSNNPSSSFSSGVPGHKSHFQQQTPNSLKNGANTPESHLNSSIRSSLRPRVPSNRNRIQGVQRILNYQPTDESPPSTINPAQFSTAPLQQSDFADIPHESNHSELSTVSDNASGSRASERTSRKKNRESFEGKESNLSPISAKSIDGQVTQPWEFQSQIPLEPQSPTAHYPLPLNRPALSGRCARKTISNPASQDSALNFSNSGNSIRGKQLSVVTGMAARGTRQSPRLQTVTPHSNTTTPRIAVRTGSYRSRQGINPPEHSSPLAASAEFAEPEQDLIQENNSDNSFINDLPSQHKSSGMSIVPPASIAPSAMHIDPSEPLSSGLSQSSAGYDSGLNTLPTPVQESIEEEGLSSAAEDSSLASKASSSQESLRNERPVPQVDGLVMPTYPILGDDEYAIALPAEGKVQAIYNQTIKIKRKAILRFIRRRGSVNTASTSTTKTIERNEMIELIGRLHDTTTHIDLGLPGIPTQYNIPSQEHAAYAQYAGSKFVFLGLLMDYFKRRPETIVIMAKSGGTQDLLEEYLYMKNVQVRRHERAYNNQQLNHNASASPKVELISTKPNQIVEIDEKPSLIIAFDASFEALDPQVRSLKAKSTDAIPIIHFMVTNSSEHVERCLPPSMPSPIRLRLLVRATYQAHLNLGGSPTIITNPSDELDGRPMDLADISRAVRKSPNRRLQNVAAVVANAVLSNDFASNWTLTRSPNLALNELEESPSTGSTISATPGRSRDRSRTPVSKAAGQNQTRSQSTSRATTPSARKRQLEVDTTDLTHKRLRMTPVSEHPDARESEIVVGREQELLRIVESLRAELANEKKAREAVEQLRDVAEKKAAGWQSSLADLQRRYEKRTKKSHAQQKANKSLMLATENSKTRVEKVTENNASLRQQISQQKLDLEAARTALKSAGGEIAALEIAREEARNATAKATALEKSLENHKRDFEFLRSQYQDASNKAAELGSQATDLEAKVAALSSKASDEKRRLKELNHAESVKQHLAKISQLETEKRNVQVMYKKLEEESKLLKRNRGVQTRGSSTAPGSPGQRSRQGSPAPGNLAPPSGSRASVLRHER